MEKFEKIKDNLLLSSDQCLLDIDLIHSFLSQSYWSKGIPKETVKKGIENSLSLGLYKNKEQIGFCRLITDYASFAYLADVFIIETERSHGYAEWMINSLKEIPTLKNLRRWMLATKDAHNLYSKTGWEKLENPNLFMQKIDNEVYKNKTSTC
ncbi:GNAT family N-acetyltransferase [Arcticibacterium luteifluviistationis]|uniref:GNAT family N-acetyltransferase n=1 Tax=Arcticibacterium luteifluviistationis TaxID=1784714 RepID=A0A2Z4GAD8_9BACT|nr:GNAT family N-acetyltransferase [Arcticibacterium luteifluviistationis]AWV98114.1 GNAT family N-acetyltransferase [Arcticibacterium luteifluviistationis]